MARARRNILINRILDDVASQYAARYLRGRLVDIGCGTKPYARQVAPYVQEHVGVDHAETLHDRSNIDLLGTAYQIPAADASFDSALCTAVLEHLEEPLQALQECRRVLKPGGAAVYTVPFIWHLHEEPRDFYRFSKYGLRYLFEKAGFEIVEIRALSGFFTTFGTLLSYYICRLNRGPLRLLRLIDGACLAIQGLASLMDRISRDERYTWMYVVAARKPLPSQADPPTP
jgi:SAM-dependent methyltransferase